MRCSSARRSTGSPTRGPARSPACCGRGVPRDPLQPERWRLRAELPEAFWDAYHAGRDREAAGADGENGSLAAPFPGPFEPLTEASYPNPVELDREGVLAQAASWSMVAAFRSRNAQRLLARLSELVPDEVYRHPLRTDSTGPAPLGARLERFRFASDVAFAPKEYLLERVTVAPLSRSLSEGSPFQAAVFRVEPGGRIARHPAT